MVEEGHVFADGIKLFQDMAHWRTLLCNVFSHLVAWNTREFLHKL